LEKLIITVTVDSSASYPGYKNMPPIDDTKTVAEEYIRAVNAGASLVHHHGVHYLEDKIQPDGRKLSKINFEGWKDLTDRIRDKVDAIIQYGIASARVEEKIKLMEQGPEMMSFCFNAHDEYFQPDPAYPANELYAIHPRSELEQFTKACLKYNVKPDCESFHTGAIWNFNYIKAQGLIKDPAWITMLDPATQWLLMPVAIALGGHVRVGWEDNPYMPDGSLSKTNAEQVEVAVQMAKVAGREVATAAEARKIMGLDPRPARVPMH
jgi:3-keto-5-aminohexanoate cleavage enzyme